MRKIIAILLATGMCLSLAGCGSADAEELIEEYEEEISELKEQIKEQKKELEEKENALAERDQTIRDYEELLYGSEEAPDTEGAPDTEDAGNSSEKQDETADNNSTASNTDHPLLQFFYGEWEYQQHKQDDLPFMKLVAERDGTCVVDEKAGTWKVLGSDEEWMRVEISVDDQVIGIAQVEINDYGQYEFEAFPPGANFSFYDDWKNNVEIVADENDVTLTTENWREYFEIFLDDAAYNENSFGEVTHMQLEQYIVLKEEYADKVLAQDVVYEMKINAHHYEIEVDGEERTYKIGEIKFPREISYMGELVRRYFFDGTRKYSLCMINMNQVAVAEEKKAFLGTTAALINDLDSVEMIRMKGTLYFKNE